VKSNREMGIALRLSNSGVAVPMRGRIMGVRFDRQSLAIYTSLHSGAENQIAIDALTQLDTHRVPGIALMPTERLVHGMLVENVGKRLLAPVGKGALSRMHEVKKIPSSWHLLPGVFIT
jgi:F-type H+-transporting ATPase subunit beta